MDMMTPQRSLQTDELGPTSKTLMLKPSKASSIGWIELFFIKWCTPAGNPNWYGPVDSIGTTLLILLN
jgi:hypothetical protein